MSQHTTERLLSGLGSTLAVNGGMLAISPGRFATLRRADWLPDAVNGRLEWLARFDRDGRALGIGLTLLGLLLLAVSMLRVRPLR